MCLFVRVGNRSTEYCVQGHEYCVDHLSPGIAKAVLTGMYMSMS